MFPGMNPKKMQGMMKQMGISQEEVPSSKVTIEKTDGSKIVIDNPSVQKIKMQGQETFQVSGEVREESPEVGVSDEDVQTVVEKTGCSEDEARQSLEKTGDLTDSIMELSE